MNKVEVLIISLIITIVLIAISYPRFVKKEKVVDLNNKMNKYITELHNSGISSNRV